MLTSTRYEAVLDFLDEALSVEGAEPFPDTVLRSMQEVVPCDALSYREWSATEILESGLAADDPAAWESVWPAYLEVRDEDPLPGGPARDMHPCALPDVEWLGRPLTITDLVGERSFRHSGLYAEMCRPLGVRAVLKLFLPTDGSTGASFVFDTTHRHGFSDGDRQVLLRVVPHLTKLRRNAHARSHHAELVNAAAEEDTKRLRCLTPREQVVLARAASGATNTEIASALYIGSSTVRKHLEHIYEKLQVKNRAAATALYVRASGN